MSTQLERMDDIEAWRQKAFTLSRTDRLGRMIVKTIDLIQTVVRDGPNAEILMHEVECLKKAQAHALTEEPKADNIFRYLLFGMSDCVNLMVESIQERNKIAQNAMKDATIARKSSQNDEEVQILKVVSPTLPPLVPKKAVPDGSTNAELTVTPKTGRTVSKAVTDTSTQSEIRQPPSKRQRSSILQNDANAEPTSVAAAATPAATTAVDSAATPTPRAARAAAAAKTAAATCNFCDKKFKLKGQLNFHMVMHTGQQCGDCGVWLKNHENLCKHYAQHHPEKSPHAKEKEDEEVLRSLKCTQCDFKADYPSQLRLHLLVHSGERPFKCSKCDKSFTRSTYLKLHAHTVHGVNPYECEACGADFSTGSELSKHIRERHTCKRKMHEDD